jgi:hypothetical protein
MYGNVDYNHKDKYFINALLSYDASSRYGSELLLFRLSLLWGQPG